MAINICKVAMIPLDKIHPNDFNPNEQSDETFNQLHEEIMEDGFDHPLNVCPCSCDKISGPHYVIIGGEHRYRVLKLEDTEEAPCVINESWDELQQKFKTVRRNLLTGHLNTRKFTDLVKGMGDRVDPTTLHNLFGFDNQKSFEKHLIQERDTADTSFLDELVAETKREKFAVDSLTDIIAEIFGSSAATLDQNYLLFCYKGKTHLALQMDDETWKVVQKMVVHLEDSGETATDFVQSALEMKLL